MINLFSNRLALLIISLGILATIAIGFAFTNGFLANFVAELFGVFAGVIVAVTIAQYLIEQHRETEWGKVRDLTLRDLCVHIVEFQTTFVLLDFHPTADTRIIAQGRSEPNVDVVEVMKETPQLMKEYFEKRIRRDEDALIRDVDRLYEETKWDMGQIREVLIPRIFQISTNKGLIDLLGILDRAYRDWQHTRIADKQAGIGYGQVFGSALGVFKAATEVYEFIAEKYYT